MRKFKAAAVPILMALLALGACTRSPDVASEDAWLQKIYENFHEKDEALALKAARGRAERRGDNLALALANGKSLTLHRDISNCEWDDEVHCHNYLFIADLPSRHFYLVSESFYEGGSYWLIDDRTGHKTEIMSVPIFSPDGSYFLTQTDDEVSEYPNKLEIWHHNRDEAVMEWNHTAVDPSYWRSYHTRVISWQDNKIRLAFTDDDMMYNDETKNRPVQHWTGTIARDGNSWRLQANWPKQ